MKINTPTGIEALENCGWKITEVIGSQREGKSDWIIEQAQHCKFGTVLQAMNVKQVIGYIVENYLTTIKFSHSLEIPDRRVYKFKHVYEQEEFAEKWNGVAWAGQTVEGYWIATI